MKIKSIEVVRLVHPERKNKTFSSPNRRNSFTSAGNTLSANMVSDPKTKGYKKAWPTEIEVANPMSKFPRFKKRRQLYGAKQWPQFGVKITAENGTWGLGMSAGRPAAIVVEDTLSHILEGENCFAIDKLWDMMFRVSKSFGTAGICSLAISAIDLALWDLVGKLQDKPVYELLGGPARDRLFIYATGNDVEWYKELGFRAFKLPCQYGPVDGLWGLQENERRVSEVRKLVGDDCEIMLDCYMAFDLEYAVRLADRLRPYNLRWMEECLIPEDVGGHIELKKRLPWLTLASGEHFYTPYPYQLMIENRCLDILQPDIQWVGGLSACIKICNMAASAGLEVCLHGGGRDAYGQHLGWAVPNISWGEYYIGSDPGIPLEEVSQPGAQIPRNSYLEFKPTGPGFDLKIEEDWLIPFQF